MGASARGAALIDLVFTCGLAATLAGIAIPAIHATRDRDAARMAARYLAERFHAMRVDALRRNLTVAIRFDPTDVGRFSAYADGDGDGVLQSDIDSGTDHPMMPDARLADYFHSVGFRIRQDVPDPDGTGTLAAGSDPVRIGSSNLLSFSPLGSATSGTIYLTGESGPQMAVRVFGSTGRIRVLSFDTASRQWRAD